MVQKALSALIAGLLVVALIFGIYKLWYFGKWANYSLAYSSFVEEKIKPLEARISILEHKVEILEKRLD